MARADWFCELVEDGQPIEGEEVLGISGVHNAEAAARAYVEGLYSPDLIMPVLVRVRPCVDGKPGPEADATLWRVRARRVVTFTSEQVS